MSGANRLRVLCLLCIVAVTQLAPAQDFQNGNVPAVNGNAVAPQLADVERQAMANPVIRKVIQPVYKGRKSVTVVIKGKPYSYEVNERPQQLRRARVKSTVSPRAGLLNGA